MIEAGIFDNDWAIVDRAVRPQVNQIVVAILHDEFTLKYLRRQRNGSYFLEAANDTYPPFYPVDGTLEIFGVARTVFRPLPGFTIQV